MALTFVWRLTGTLDDASLPGLPPAMPGRSLRRLLPASLVHEGVVIDQHIREGRFQRSLSLVAGVSGLLAGLEVAYQHYRGSYSQRVMYSPLIVSLALFVAGLWGACSRRAARTALPVVSLLTMADGIVGFVFHVRGVARKPGGWRFPVFNLIMGPPVFAPLLFAVCGYLGLIAALLRREDAPRRPQEGPSRAGVSGRQVREGRFQRQLAIAAALSALFSGIEALYAHYKDNFTYGVQWTPVVLTPLLVVAGVGTIWSRRIARTLLPVVSVLALLDGAVGTFYHARGILRRPGGLKLPLYNLLYGPPIFAPLLFAASGFMGLLASLLRREE